MDIISSTVLRNNFSTTVDAVTSKKNYLLVAKRGKIVSALVNIDLFEDLLALVNRNYVKSIKKARKEYRSGDILSHIDVFGEV